MSERLNMNVSKEIKKLVEKHAKHYGMTMQSYICHLVLKEEAELEKEYEAMRQLKKRYYEALKDELEKRGYQVREEATVRYTEEAFKIQILDLLREDQPFNRGIYVESLARDMFNLVDAIYDGCVEPCDYNKMIHLREELKEVYFDSTSYFYYNGKYYRVFAEIDKLLPYEELLIEEGNKAADYEVLETLRDGYDFVLIDRSAFNQSFESNRQAVVERLNELGLDAKMVSEYTLALEKKEDKEGESK